MYERNARPGNTDLTLKHIHIFIYIIYTAPTTATPARGLRRHRSLSLSRSPHPTYPPLTPSRAPPIAQPAIRASTHTHRHLSPRTAPTARAPYQAPALPNSDTRASAVAGPSPYTPNCRVAAQRSTGNPTQPVSAPGDPPIRLRLRLALRLRAKSSPGPGPASPGTGPGAQARRSTRSIPRRARARQPALGCAVEVGGARLCVCVCLTAHPRLRIWQISTRARAGRVLQKRRRILTQTTLDSLLLVLARR
ncbi:hypothetical protein DFH11DRAFT_1195762 [Phellopilus nigrolimitatus]|nr:hypothetical protein DFH11DRAFT_1195762 [Phellopilus nigrolimitatus]